MKPLCMAVLLLWTSSPEASAYVGPLRSRLAHSHSRFLEDRCRTLPSLGDPFGAAPAARPVVEPPDSSLFASQHPWKRNITATVFWVGELPTEHNPTPNTQSAWDPNWLENYGGYDDPNQRIGWLPATFIPKLNPFYVALPYNDVAPGGTHQPEASSTIPWFWEHFRGSGISVCKGRWVLIHHQGRVCFAQWEDVGPFATDHWQYLFGNEPPRPNRNQSAGIDVSPAIRDYLGLRSGQTVEWRFVDDHQVPDGPWRDWNSSLPSTPRSLPAQY